VRSRASASSSSAPSAATGSSGTQSSAGRRVRQRARNASLSTSGGGGGALPSRWIVLSVLLLAAAAASPGAAAPAPGQACQSAQLRAGSRSLKAQLQCWSKHHKKPTLDPSSCLAKAGDAFAAAWQASLDAAGPGVCGTEASAADVRAALEDEVGGLLAAVDAEETGTSKPEQRLNASLLKALGAALARALGAESKHAKKPDPAKQQSARDKARAKLLSAFAKAEARAGKDEVAYGGLEPAAVADEVDRVAGDLVALTLPPDTSFTVSGTIRAAEASLVDSDVNDPNVPPLANDTPAAAQAIPVPAVVGGYVNVAGFGPIGNSQPAGDESDFFRVSLEAGQRVNLRFADPLTADLELCLYEDAAPPVLLDCSLGTSETEELAAPSSGGFLIEVFPFPLCACGSSYILTLGQLLPSAGPNGLRLSDEFVPGEVVVTLGAAAQRLGAAAQPMGGAPAGDASAHAAELGLEALAGTAEREMLFRIPSPRAGSVGTLAVEAGRSALDARLAEAPAALREKLDTLLAVKALGRRADVAAAEPNFVRHALATPNDAYFGLQWHYPLVNLPAAWDLTTGSAAVEVAVIDTGVRLAHPDLQGQLAPGYDFISDPMRAVDGDGIDANADDPGDGGGLQRSSFHGTHVAGTIGAATNNGSGVAGVAWDVTLVPLRVLGLGGGTSYDIRQAVRFAAGLSNDSNTVRPPVDVINLSLGGAGFSSLDQSTFAAARAEGVIVIAAAGNSASSQLFYPASYDGVVSVSAVDLRRQKAPYSNFGSEVDVAAPGGDTGVDRNGDGYVDGVLSTLADEFTGLFSFVFYQGTSMASPHVAGVAALMKAVKPSLGPVELDTLLASGALTSDLGAAGRDDFFGHGLIDARRAVEAVSAAPPDAPVLLVTPTGLNLGSGQSQAPFEVANGGGGMLEVTLVTDDRPWLSVSPTSGLGTYTVSVDRTGLANGTYAGAITVQSSAGSATVAVVMAVVSSAPGADAGFHYVLVVDPETRATVAQDDVAANEAGEYVYELADVPAGSWYVFAGSDSDNDLVICRTGEACGAFPTLGAPERIELTADLTSLDFVTGFLQSLESSAAGTGPERPVPGLRRLERRRLAR